MSKDQVREDPIKMHKDANNLMENGEYETARELFLRTAELYTKKQNFFDATTMLYKAGECGFALKEYETAIKHFSQSAELAFQKGFDRFGVSALEYERDCHNALGNKAKTEELEGKIKEVKEELAKAF